MAASTLAYVSGWASILSLAITLLNTCLILRIKAGIVVNLTLEPMLVRLTENSAENNEHLSSYYISSPF
jgi:hypothetical protein